MPSVNLPRPSVPVIDPRTGLMTREWYRFFHDPSFPSVASSTPTGVASGGTGLSSGASGGVLGFTSTATLASSVLLAANQIVLGGGAGATPKPLGSLGTATTVLHGNAAGAPSFGAVNLSNDVTGPLRADQTATMGAGAGTTTGIGVFDVQTSAAGVGNGADLTDDVLFTKDLPLNSMSANGKSVRTVASGHFATNGNNKRVKLWFAGTAIADSGVVASSNTDWTCEAEVTRIDATHVSSKGTFTANGVATAVTVTPNLVVADLVANASTIKTTGASPTTGAANDVLGHLMKTWFEN